MPGSAASSTAPLTRRQVSEAERARATEVAGVTAATPESGTIEPAPADSPTAGPAPVATRYPMIPRDAVETEIVLTPVVSSVSRRELRPERETPARRIGAGRRAAALTVLGVLTVALPLTDLDDGGTDVAAAAVPVVRTQPSVLDTLDAVLATAELEAATSDTGDISALLADPSAQGRAEITAAARASEREVLPEEALEGASGAAAAVVEPEPEPQFALPVATDASRITSNYGYRSWPIAGEHTGVDFAAPLGTPIHAVADGVVTYVGPGKDGRSSMLIVVEHEVDGEHFQSWYNHMFSTGLYVEVGQQVEVGDEIAGVGNNGYSTGPHLHFEIHLDDSLTTTDPIPWLAAREAVDVGLLD